MVLIRTIFQFFRLGVLALVTAAVLLIILRSLFNYRDVNPFKRSAITLRRVTDPILVPIRHMLISFRLDPKATPVIAVLVILILGYLGYLIVQTILNTIAGVIYAVTSGSSSTPVAIAGYILYGLLGLYTLMIFLRFVFSWGQVGYGNRMNRFLIRITEPLLGPLRRTIPPVRMFDISPMIALVIVWLLEFVVAATFLPRWPLGFM